MPPISGNIFLEAVGYAIINNLWQFAILWLLHSGALFFINLSSEKRYKVGLLFQFTGFIWFIANFLFYYTNNNSQVASQALSENGFFNGNLNYFVEKYQLLPIIAIGYFLLLSFFSVKGIRAYYQTSALRKNGLSKIDVQWRLFVQQHVLHLGIKQKVRIHLSHLVDSPLTIGFFKPLILMPFACVNYLNNQQFEAVILHELAHIKRFDYLINLLLIVANTFLIFNPFSNLINQSIKKERENSCDDFVLQFQYNPATYAEALYKLAANETTHPSVFALQAAQNSGLLLLRIKRIIGNTSKRSFNFKQQLIAPVFLLLSIFSLLVIPQKINSKTPLVAANNTNENRVDENIEFSSKQLVTTAIPETGNVSNAAIKKAETKNDLQEVIDFEKKNQKEESSDLFSYSGEALAALPKLQFINTNKKERIQKTNTIEAQLLQDVNVVLNQAAESNKQVDAITVKTIMLARIRQLIDENAEPQTESAQNNLARLQMLERNIASNVITNVMASSEGSVQESDQIVTIQYTIPEDESGNSYVFEYIIHPNKKNEKVNEKDLILKDTLLLPKGPLKVQLPIIKI